MSFPPSVVDRVLLACGRHCALCHKYCGLKIELHHIQLRSAGGSDSFENCIPLCFDCHADMRSYDHKHPKGRKFSELELVAHRDGWYRKFETTGGAAASAEHLELDRKQFRRVMELLPFDGIISQLRNRHGGQPFRRQQLAPLEHFLEAFHNPSFEFLDADLDAVLAALKASVAEYDEYVSVHVFVSDDGTQLVIHPEMKHSDPDWYYSVVYEIARKEGRLLDAYSSFVKLVRRKLAIDANVG